MAKITESTLGCDVPLCLTTSRGVWVPVDYPAGWRSVLGKDVCPQHTVVVTVDGEGW